MDSHGSETTSLAARQLAVRVDRTILDFRKEVPKATDADVYGALHLSLQKVHGKAGLSWVQGIALALVITMVIGMIAFAGKLASTDPANVFVVLVGAFAVASIGVLFIVAQHHG